MNTSRLLQEPRKPTPTLESRHDQRPTFEEHVVVRHFDRQEYRHRIVDLRQRHISTGRDQERIRPHHHSIAIEPRVVRPHQRTRIPALGAAQLANAFSGIGVFVEPQLKYYVGHERYEARDSRRFLDDHDGHASPFERLDQGHDVVAARTIR